MNPSDRSSAAHARPAIRSLFSKVAGAVLLGLMTFNVIAQTNVPSGLPANRWLFVVETSRATERQAQAIKDLVPSLVFSGVDGQLRRGDTIGVWTFNSDLHSGEFPLQQWTPDNRRAVAQRVAGFLENRKFERAARIGPVLTNLQNVIRNSEFITVVLVTDGQQKMQGTPFDDQINSSYSQWQRQQERARLPFVTILRAARGKITDYAVNTPPFPLQMPPLPSELLVAPTPAPAPKPVVTEKPRVTAVATSTVAPLILIGRRPEPEPVITPNTLAATPEPAALPDPTGDRATSPSAQPDPPMLTQASPASAPTPTPPASPVMASASQTSGMPSDSSAGEPPALEAEQAEWTTVDSDVVPMVAASGPQPLRTMLVIAGIVALGCVIGILIVLKARSRTHASLITRSLDRQPK